MTISLDELAELAKAVSSGMPGGPWFLEHQIGIHGSPTTRPERQFIAACDPATILKLLAVVKATKAFLEAPSATGSEDECYDTLKAAIAALDTP